MTTTDWNRLHLAGKATVTVTPPSQLVSTNRQEFKAKVLELLETAAGLTQIIVDCTNCGYIDSSGLGVLVAVNKKARDRQVQIVIRGLNADLTILFQLTKLDSLFTLEPAVGAW
jgi:anti-sigma B factor antagonist